MARRQNDDSFLNDELEAAFNFGDDLMEISENEAFSRSEQNEIVEEENELPGQLAVDVYETEDKLFVKARTAGVNKNDLDVSLSDGTLTISGSLNPGDQEGIIAHHAQECYWGEFSRTLTLPVPIKEDEVEAILKDGILTISYTKVKTQATRIKVL